MSLYVKIYLSDSAIISGEFDAWKNRVIPLEITNGREIVESLRSVLAQQEKPSIAHQSIYMALRTDYATSFAGPWLQTVRINGNSIEGLDSSNNAITLSVDINGTPKQFWEDSFEKIVIGTGPYLV